MDLARLPAKLPSPVSHQTLDRLGCVSVPSAPTPLPINPGLKATLATAPDADILREIICLLTQRVRAGRATFLIKVKSHRGEPINERADTLAEEGRAISDDDKGGTIGLIG
jgi:hypothetical protein